MILEVTETWIWVAQVEMTLKHVKQQGFSSLINNF